MNDKLECCLRWTRNIHRKAGIGGQKPARMSAQLDKYVARLLESDRAEPGSRVVACRAY